MKKSKIEILEIVGSEDDVLIDCEIFDGYLKMFKYGKSKNVSTNTFELHRFGDPGESEETTMVVWRSKSKVSKKQIIAAAEACLRKKYQEDNEDNENNNA